MNILCVCSFSERRIELMAARLLLSSSFAFYSAPTVTEQPFWHEHNLVFQTAIISMIAEQFWVQFYTNPCLWTDCPGFPYSHKAISVLSLLALPIIHPLPVSH